MSSGEILNFFFVFDKLGGWWYNMRVYKKYVTQTTMGMFDNMKQMREMMSQANELKALQKKLAKKTITVEKDGVTVTLDGTQAIKNIEISDELMDPSKKKKLVQAIIGAIDDSKSQIQRELMQEMM
jgi:DNA-binding protein YbaB